MNTREIYFNTNFVHGRKGGKSYYQPIHESVHNLAFEFDTTDPKADEQASAEANLCDAMARVGEAYGLGGSEIVHMLPFVLRALKSNSAWTK